MNKQIAKEGHKGGNATLQKFGRIHFKKLAKKSVKKRREKALALLK